MSKPKVEIIVNTGNDISVHEPNSKLINLKLEINISVHVHSVHYNWISNAQLNKLDLSSSFIRILCTSMTM